MSNDYRFWFDKDGSTHAVIPLGVRLNEKYNSFYSKVKKRSIFVSSQKDKNFKKEIQTLKMIHSKDINPIKKLVKGKKFLDKNVVMEIIVYDKNNRPDIDALEKSVQDAMNGILYDDDKQIWDKHTIQYVDAQSPRVEIHCREKVRYEHNI